MAAVTVGCVQIAGSVTLNFLSLGLSLPAYSEVGLLSLCQATKSPWRCFCSRSRNRPHLRKTHAGTRVTAQEQVACSQVYTLVFFRLMAVMSTSHTVYI